MIDPKEDRVQITRVGTLHLVPGLPLLPAGWLLFLPSRMAARERQRVQAGTTPAVYVWRTINARGTG